LIEQIKVYDIDGTIVCSQHRYRPDASGNNIDLPHWREHCTPEFIFQDTLLPMAEAYKSDLENPSIYVIIATARVCEENDANYQFIAEKLGKPDMFIHRGTDDNRGGAQLKIQAIKPLLNLKQFKNAIVHVYEDNLKYMQDLCQALNAIGHYIPSKQGL